MSTLTLENVDPVIRAQIESSCRFAKTLFKDRGALGHAERALYELSHLAAMARSQEQEDAVALADLVDGFSCTLQLWAGAASRMQT